MVAYENGCGPARCYATGIVPHACFLSKKYRLPLLNMLKSIEKIEACSKTAKAMPFEIGVR